MLVLPFISAAGFTAAPMPTSSMILVAYVFVSDLFIVCVHAGVSTFHFYYCLCAFEIAPMLLINKLWLGFLARWIKRCIAGPSTYGKMRLLRLGVIKSIKGY